MACCADFFRDHSQKRHFRGKIGVNIAKRPLLLSWTNSKLMLIIDIEAIIGERQDRRYRLVGIIANGFDSNFRAPFSSKHQDAENRFRVHDVIAIRKMDRCVVICSAFDEFCRGTGVESLIIENNEITFCLLIHDALICGIGAEPMRIRFTLQEIYLEIAAPAKCGSADPLVGINSSLYLRHSSSSSSSLEKRFIAASIGALERMSTPAWRRRSIG